jgi:hypothetical protein
MSACEIEYTDEFAEWWNELSELEQDDIGVIVDLLAVKGTSLGFPYSSGINQSRHTHMRELRIQSGGHPMRIFMLLTHGGVPFYCLAVIRLVKSDFMKSTFRLRIACMMSILKN